LLPGYCEESLAQKPAPIASSSLYKIAHFGSAARNHDVSQNYASLLHAIENDPPYSILDLGCGPGRDLRHFRSLGHNAVGLDGSKEFVAMARSYSGCEVLHQDFLAMVLPQSRFDGVFANASLFHVPSQELPRILLELRETLRPRVVLFCSNPRETARKALAMAATLTTRSIHRLCK
jgi:trans-aconitate methyltransferase